MSRQAEQHTRSDKSRTRRKAWSSRWKRNSAHDFDYVVIGSGMAGLTCAASLAKMKSRVLVLEQHYTVGGYTQTFRRRSWSWDVGVHIVGEVTQDDEFGRLLRYLTDGRLEWAPLPSSYDRYHYPDGFVVEYGGGPGAYVEGLCAAFPEERPVIEAWRDLCEHAYSKFVRHVKTKIAPPTLGHLAQQLIARNIQHEAYMRTCQDVLDELTDNERLKAVLAGQWLYWGCPPSETAFATSAAVLSHFERRGAFYPVGGSQRIAEELTRTIVDAGGEVRVRAAVKQILFEGDCVVGVRVEGRHGEADEDLSISRVVSTIGVPNTISDLFPEPQKNHVWARSFDEIRPSTAYVCLFLGFEGDIREAGVTGQSHGFYDTWDIEAEWNIEGVERVGRVPFMWASFNSLKDPKHEGPHTGEVMAPLAWKHVSRWADSQWRRRDQEYDLFKATLTDQMLDQFLDYMPALRPYVSWAELSTPLSAAHFVGANRGATYGLDHTPERFANDALRPQTPFSGLYLAGTDTVCAGLLGAGFSGFVAAAAAAPVRSLPILRAILF